eukprot:gene27295-36036_t
MSRQRESAKVWKTQESFLDKGIMSNRLLMKDKLKVSIALKYMRKAHVEGSKADQERQLLSKAIFNKPEEGVVLPYSEAKALTMRKIEDIVEDAKSGFFKIKERNNALKKCAEVETLKPGFLKFVESIKQEYVAQQMALSNMSDVQETAKVPSPLLTAAPLSARSSISLISMSKIDKSISIPNTSSEPTPTRERPKSAPHSRRVAMIKFAEPEQHDVFAEKSDLQDPSQEPESNIDANSQSSTSSVRNRVWGDIIVARNAIQKSKRDAFDTAMDLPNNLNKVRNERFSRRPSSATMGLRKSSCFMERVVESDENVIMALRRRNAIAVKLLSYSILKTDTLSDSSGRAVDQWLLTNFITWVSFFELFPSLRVDSGGVPLSVLLDILPPQHPRYYSLASSLDASPDEFTLVVGQHSFAVSNDNDNGNDNDTTAVDIRHGTCSSYIRSLRRGDEVEFRIIPVRSFRLPISNSAPVVCVSTGTGFAPIYGFVKQRLQRMRDKFPGEQAGEFILIHGARDKSERPFVEELEEAVAKGAITAIHYALSRSPPPIPKQYVQDLILSPVVAAQLRDALTRSEKSSVYVCGDANMAQSVRAALSSESILSPNGLLAMIDRGSYHEEIFGIFNPQKK